MEHPTREPGYPTKPCPRCGGQRVAAQLHNEYDGLDVVNTRVMLKCLECGTVRWFDTLEEGMHAWLLVDEDGNVRFGKDGLSLEMWPVR